MTEDIVAKIFENAQAAGLQPCPICLKPKGAHPDEKAKECMAEIEARDLRKDISIKLIGEGAITRQTMDANWWSSDGSKAQHHNTLLGFTLEDYHLTVYLYGDFGTGKTYQARCILNEAMKQGKRVIDINGVALAKMLRRQFNQPKLVEACRYYTMLLIDDIDKAGWESKEIEGLWEILEARSDRSLKTIITANIHPKEFKDAIAAGCGGNQTRAESLIQRLHPCLILEFKGESLR